MSKYFGTDGFRGEANVTLTPFHAYKVGRFLGHYFSKNNQATIVIGKDTRLSGDMLEAALISGITASGANVKTLGVTTTPNVSYITRVEDFACGIMISASHNPFYDNGIKVINHKGHKLEAKIEDLVEEYIDREEDDLPFAGKEHIGVSLPYPQGVEKYISYLKSKVNVSFKSMNVGLDLANGSASHIAADIFRDLGANVTVISNSPDGLNINTNCGSTHIESLVNLVTSNKLDIGFAYDGDSDRCMAVDQNGRVIDGDLMMYVCAKHMKSTGELATNKIVTTVMSNIGLYLALDNLGIGYEKTAVGDKYVYENMLLNNHAIGGEQSGHIIFNKDATTGDGILTSLKIMEVVISLQQSLADLASEVDIFPQLLVNVRVHDKKDAQDDVDVIAKVKEVEETLGNQGRILVRQSGTEPLIRVMVEAKTDELCEKYVYSVIDVLKAKGHVSQ